MVLRVRCLQNLYNGKRPEGLEDFDGRHVCFNLLTESNLVNHFD